MAAVTAAILGGAALAGAGIKAYSDYKASKQQARAAGKAARAQQNIAAQQANAQTAAAREGQGYIEAAGNRAGEALGRGYNDALSSLAAGTDQARGSLESGYGQGLASLGSARSSLAPTLGLQRYADSATKSVYDNLGGLAGLQQDPGYQFRLSEGLKAINQAASAHGGRMGGDTLKALSDYAQQSASQEYGNYAQRRMTADLAAQQNQYGLAGLGFGAQGRVADTYLNQAGMQQGEGQQLADLARMSGSERANLQTGMGTALGNQLMQTAQGRANTLTNGAAGSANTIMQTLPSYASQVPYAGAGAAAFGNAASSAIGNISYLGSLAAMGAFSGGGQAAGAGAPQAYAPNTPYHQPGTMLA